MILTFPHFLSIIFGYGITSSCDIAMLRLLAGNIARSLTAACLHNGSWKATASKPTTRGFLWCNTAFLSNLKPIQSIWTNTPAGVGILKSTSSVQLQSTRPVTKFSLNKGKRKSVKAVLKRFKRLDWGIWIRTHSGRNKKLYKKSAALKRRLRQHVFTNASQSWLLDSMVTDFWRRPKYYINDPYEPYHKRNEYFATKSKTLKI